MNRINTQYNQSLQQLQNQKAPNRPTKPNLSGKTLVTQHFPNGPATRSKIKVQIVAKKPLSLVGQIQSKAVALAKKGSNWVNNHPKLVKFAAISLATAGSLTVAYLLDKNYAKTGTAEAVGSHVSNIAETVKSYVLNAKNSSSACISNLYKKIFPPTELAVYHGPKPFTGPRNHKTYDEFTQSAVDSTPAQAPVATPAQAPVATPAPVNVETPANENHTADSNIGLLTAGLTALLGIVGRAAANR